jgi:hypothetical protein
LKYDLDIFWKGVAVFVDGGKGLFACHCFLFL